MRQVLILLALALLALPSLGQDDNAIRYVCSNGASDVYEYRTIQDEPNIAVGAYSTLSPAYYGYSEGGAWHRISFQANLSELPTTHYAYLYPDTSSPPILSGLVLETVPCQDSPIEVIPTSECLGIAPSALNLPNSGVFEVDGLSYAYSDNLSFIVPQTSYWQWDLYHYGTWLLRFEQSEAMPCQVTAMRGD